MKKVICLTMFCYFISIFASAHPGGVDVRGGHYVHSSGWGYEIGSYHFHDGDFVTEIKNGIPQVDIDMTIFPRKLYPDDIAEIKIDMSDRFRDQLVLSVDNDHVTKLTDYQLKAVNYGVATVNAYVNEDSHTSCSVEVFPFPKETITLECSEKIFFKNKPFTIKCNVEYTELENAPSWDREPSLEWASSDADIEKIDNSTAKVVCNMRGKASLKVRGELGGVAVYNFNVYGILDILLWIVIAIFLITLIVISLKWLIKHK